jgi:uncharacterized protein
MSFAPLPARAAWRMYDAHEGFEVVAIESGPDGARFTGTSVGVEERVPWSFRYVVEVDASWHGLRATIDAADGRRLTVEAEGPGRWLVNGTHDAALDGCIDIDLEGSALTNTAPVHRLGLDVGAEGDSAAVYVRSDLSVERLDQTYRRLPAEHGFAFDYASPRFDYRAALDFAADGLVADYPRIAQRVDVLQ